MKGIKYLGALFISIIIVFILLVNFSSVASSYACTGSISNKDTSLPVTIYIKLEQYRWWVGLWSDSDGSLWLEIPNKTVEYFERVKEAGDILQISNYKKVIKGNFSTLSKTLALKTPYGFFDGTCKVNAQ